MCAKKHYILNWLLITVMVMLPLRGALASELADCQMKHEQSDKEQHQTMIDHSAHMMSGSVQAGAGDAVEKSAATPGGDPHQCCDDKGMMCNNDCASMMSMSFVIHSASSIDARYHSVLTAQTTTDVLLRALPPLERPPAYFQG